ncbi:MAG: HMA2 domain-containing protein [Desulfomonilaceae bacterium]
MGYYLHEVPGRLRIQISSLKRNSQRAQEVQDLLEDLSGIKSTSVNTVTGSVIVHYDPDIVHSRTILTLLSREEYIDVARAVSSHQYVETTLSKAGHLASKALLGFALDRALQGSPLSILAAFI